MEHLASAVERAIPWPPNQPTSNGLNGQNGAANRPKRPMAPDPRLCPQCQGMGFVYDVHPLSPYGHAAVRCPVCGQQRQQEYLRRMCGLSPEMAGWTFENTRPGRNGDAFQTAAALAQGPQWMLTLTGPYGVGKTRLLACLVNAGRAAGWPSVYTTTAALLDHLRSAYAPKSDTTFDGLWEKVIGARILAIDEFDRWNPTPWAEEKFFQLIDHRYRHGGEVLTAFASNTTDLEALPGYVVSRLRDRRCHAFAMAGPDVRQLRP